MRGVLASDQGTATMREIAGAIQEGAVAFLRRQFRVILIIVVPLAVLVFLTATKVVRPDGSGRSELRPVGAVPGTGLPRGRHLLGHHRHHRHEPVGAGQRAHRSGGERRLAAGGAPGRLPHRRHHGHVLCRARAVRCRSHHVHLPEHAPRRSSWASASAPRSSPCSCESAAASSPRRLTSAPTWWARSRPASPRTTPATRPPSPTTWATTSATARAWPPTSSSPTRSPSSRRSSSASPPSAPSGAIPPSASSSPSSSWPSASWPLRWGS